MMPQIVDEFRKTLPKESAETIYVSRSTAGTSAIKCEPALIKGVHTFFKSTISERELYFHKEAWHNGNWHLHVRSALLKTSLTIPSLNKKLMLGMITDYLN